MAVKRSSSASRVLKVFEEIAASQPIGVSALARVLEADKSAVQRDLMTLADAGWIRGAVGASGQWELTPHVLTIARPPHSTDSLRQRARPALERLRSETGETAYLTVPDGDQFVVIDAIESEHLLRMAQPVGMVVLVEGTATARAILPHLPEPEQERLLGRGVTSAMREEFRATLTRGYAVNDGEVAPSAVAMASAIVSRQGVPAGALVLTGPAERLTAARRPEVGERLRREAEALTQAVG
ncbi:IclR family transcriptional regulator [Novosphingobium sp. PS1R-30]|uniref:IclR family transcriptional regulator n=1 Tax=Novosphingobium anseongense TaxID=3133436 RepID=A0ABU8RWY8_9SPHN